MCWGAAVDSLPVLPGWIMPGKGTCKAGSCGDGWELGKFWLQLKQDSQTLGAHAQLGLDADDVHG